MVASLAKLVALLVELPVLSLKFGAVLLVVLVANVTEKLVAAFVIFKLPVPVVPVKVPFHEPVEPPTRFTPVL